MSWIGREVQGCTIVELAGSGPAGEVYRAVVSGGEDIAVKFLTGIDPKDQQLQLRARRNARSWQLINDPHIIRLHWSGSLEGTVCYAMEWAATDIVTDFDPAGQLKIRQRAEARFVERALAAALDIVTGLDALHRQQIIHGALVPANVRLLASGRIALCDCGLDLSRGLAARDYRRLAFTAPEQRKDQSRADHRADLYGLGAMLYLLFTGRLPGLDQREQRVDRDANAIAPLEIVNPDLAVSIVEFIHRLLLPRPQDRFPDTAAVRDSLLHLLGRPLPSNRRRRIRQPLEPRFVGRRTEIEETARAVMRCRNKTPQLLCLEGPDGIGKSALLLHALREVPPAIRVIWPAQLNMALTHGSALQQLVRLLIKEIADRPDADRLKPKLAPHVRSLRDVAEQPGATGSDDGGARRRSLEQQAAAGLTALVDGVVKSGPVAVILDGLDLSDTTSQRVILMALRLILSEERRTLPCSIILTWQAPTEHPASRIVSKLFELAGSRASRIYLQPLDLEATQLMMSDMLGSPDIEPATAAAIHAVSHGVPGPTKDLIRLLITENLLHLADTPGQPQDTALAERLARLAGAGGESGAVSPAVILAGLAECPARTVNLLQLAALIGDHFDFEVIERATGWDQMKCLAALDPAIRRGVVLEVPGTSSTFAFANPVARMTMLNQITEEKRRQLHARLLRALQQLKGKPTGPRWARIASHAFSAGHFDTAATAGFKAGYYHHSIGSPEEAAYFIQMIGDALEHLARAGQPTPHGIRQKYLRLKGSVAISRRELTEAGETFRTLLSESEEEADPVGVFEGFWGLGRVADGLGNLQEAEELYRQSAKVAMANDMRDERAKCLLSLGICYFRLDKYTDAHRCFELAADIWQELGYELDRLRALHNLANVEAKQNNLQLALKLYLEVEAGRVKENELSGLAGLYSNIASVSMDLHQYVTAHNALQKGIELSRQFKHTTAEAGLRSVMANLLEAREQYDRALRELHKGIAVCRRVKEPSYHAIIVFQLGQLQAKRGDRGAARASFRRARAMFQRMGHASAVAETEITLAEIDAVLAPDAALAALEEAFEHGLTTEMADLNVRYHYARGVIFHSAGRFPEAWLEYQEAFRQSEQIDQQPPFDRLSEALEAARDAEDEAGAADIHNRLQRLAEFYAAMMSGPDLKVFRESPLGRYLPPA